MNLDEQVCFPAYCIATGSFAAITVHVKMADKLAAGFS